MHWSQLNNSTFFVEKGGKSYIHDKINHHKNTHESLEFVS